MSKVITLLGDDISTDHIYPGRFMATVLPSETPQFCFADMTELNAALKAKQFPEGSFLVAGENFGCGSSREQAASTILGHNLNVVAKSFARIFMQNAVNLGLPLLICPDVDAKEGDELELRGDELYNKTTGKTFKIEPLPPLRQAIINAGGLIAFTRERVKAKLAAR
ncbi:MAG: 3-isopropylmalate dehydratase small subunit [Calditrichaeota bacterium]|nr:3-isopropylmalate dehydratase small subunit [Calditrichota bacterium]MCB9367102.1 3-isopropylmalate dehydratase small subunit [Calditrichota bacterium]